MTTIAAHREASNAGALGRALLFFAVIGYYWITLTPFPNLGLASNLDPWADNSNLVNQVVALSLFAALAAFALLHPMRREIAQPRLLLALLFGWFALTSLLADDPSVALRRVVMAAMICIGASIFLLLPRDERHFGKLLGTSLLALLGLAYWGVLFLPELSIHQATDVVEPLLAGDWRGFFAHKNTAASAMALACFAAPFVWARWSRLAGAAIGGLALVFLWQTGGKTALFMLPAVFVLAFAFERWRALRVPLVAGGLVIVNLLSVGSVVFPGVRSLLKAMGVDASFTDRTEIWQFAFGAIGERPLTGYGFMSFWQTDSLVYGGGTLETWAVTAANAHNAYLDALLTAGVPGLVLSVAWLVFLPIRNMARAEGSDNDPVLTRLFVRIWLYGVFASCFESFFFANGGPIWFTMLIGVFGLGMQARSRLVAGVRLGRRLAHA